MEFKKKTLLELLHTQNYTTNMAVGGAREWAKCADS